MCKLGSFIGVLTSVLLYIIFFVADTCCSGNAGQEINSDSAIYSQDDEALLYYDGGVVTACIAEMDLVAVLNRLSVLSGTQFKIHEMLPARVTTKFSAIPLAKAINTILESADINNYTMVYATRNNKFFIEEVAVLPSARKDNMPSSSGSNKGLKSVGDRIALSTRGYSHRVDFVTVDGQITKSMFVAKETTTDYSFVYGSGQGQPVFPEETSIDVKRLVVSALETHERDLILQEIVNSEVGVSRNGTKAVVYRLINRFVLPSTVAIDSDYHLVSEGPVETTHEIIIYNSSGDELAKIRDNGSYPTISNTGEYIVAIAGNYEKRRVFNAEGKVQVELPYNSSGVFFSENDKYILFVYSDPGEDVDQFAVLHTGDLSLTSFDTARSDGYLRNVASIEIKESDRLIEVKQAYDPATGQAIKHKIEF